MSAAFITVFFMFPAAMAYAAASDLFSMTIPNRLTLGLVAGFAVCAALVGFTWNDVAQHLAVGALVLILTFGMFAAGWIGGGDAKLAAATALWFGAGQLLPYLALAGIFGGLLTLTILYYRGQPLPIAMEKLDFARRLHGAKEGVPYGIALAASALLILPDTAIWRAAIGV